MSRGRRRQNETGESAASSKQQRLRVRLTKFAMPRLCAAVGCYERNTKKSGYSFHSFPLDPARQRTWVTKMNRLEWATSGKPWAPKPHDMLCSKHFERDCFTDKTLLSERFGLKYRNTLNNDAVPTVFDHRKRPQRMPRSASTTTGLRKREVSNTRVTIYYVICSFSGNTNT